MVYTYISIFLILIGLTILLVALFPLRKLMTLLTVGTLRDRWLILAVLIFLFIISYSSYIAMIWQYPSSWIELLIPCLLLLGAIFVWSTITLSLQTAIDLQRIYVLEDENITDTLTKVYNRRYLDRRLEEEISRSKRYANHLSVLMLDIDHFKKINDTYGHKAGDDILHMFANIIKADLRDLDIIARYGGEEFVVICTNTAISGAILVAERIRNLVASKEFQINDNSSAESFIHITISIGVSEFNESINTKDLLVQTADHALYKAKKEGRNRVIAASLPL